MKYVDRLIQNKETFKHILTTNTEKVIVNGNTIWLKGQLDFSFLGLYAKVKSDVKKFEKHKSLDFTEKLRNEIDYIQFKPITEIYSYQRYACTGMKMDINACYWNEARKMFLSEETYNYGLTVKKDARLKALGALATKKIVHEYEFGNLVASYVEKSPFSLYFFKICYEVDVFFKKLLTAYASILGYWTDCFFVEQTQREVQNEIDEQIRSNRFSYKVEFCDFLLYQSKGNMFLKTTTQAKDELKTKVYLLKAKEHELPQGKVLYSASYI